jgi:O-antigen biosynthesis protein
LNQYNYQQEMLHNKHPEYYQDFIERQPYEFQSGDTKPIAFYLPQFYSFPENDEWWGKGFTEWTNVTKAMPRFEGHYQPHLAGELGYYNLMTDGIMERQIELAKMYGIYGFCFHFYMFDNRKRLLEKPLNKFLDNPDLDMPFCLCYANENWTRRWDGMENDILMAQTYSNTFEVDLAEEMLVYLQDKRYIKIDGKPLVIIYRIDILPSPTEFSNRFRGECHKLGIGEIYLCSVLSFGIGNAINYGFDDNIEFPLHGINNLSVTEKVNIFDENFNGKVFSYPNVVKSELDKDIDFPRFRGIMPSWDNEARKPNEGHIIHGSTPELYKIWLQNLCYKTINERPESKRFVFINAWNEWAEGSHLEPDRRYGYAYLEATYQAVTNQKNEVNTNAFDFENLDSQEVNKIDYLTVKKRIVREEQEKIETQRIIIEQKENYIQEQQEKIETQRIIIEQKENYIQEQQEEINRLKNNWIFKLSRKIKLIKVTNK